MSLYLATIGSLKVFGHPGGLSFQSPQARYSTKASLLDTVRAFACFSLPSLVQPRNNQTAISGFH